MKANVILNDLRTELFSKKISYLDFFKQLDINEDGFLTINEFCKAIDNVIRLSQTAKEGFFAYMDIKKIGMIDFKTFLITMNKPIYNKTNKI